MNKMTTCKTCGAEIAKSAKVCPQCGARQHQAALTAAGLIIAFTFVFIIVIAVNGSDGLRSAKNITTAPSATPAPIEISAVDLWKAYTDNEVNADNQYGDQLLAVTGTITDIGKDIVTGNPCVSLDSGSEYSLYPVQCFFSAGDKNSEALAALKDGQEITVYGTCSGAPVASVQLSDCYLAN